MCLILLAYKAHPKYNLIVAANRDEFYRRLTAPAGFWEDAPQILAGRDLEKMGTWMGVTTSGRFAALTNYRDPSELTAEKLSRGELVAEFLKGSDDPHTYLEKADASRMCFPGFNLLAGNQEGLYYYSNKQGVVQQVTPGIHGISNHLLNTSWPKVEKGKAGLARIIREDRQTMADDLLVHMENADPAPEQSLPSTGVSLEWERLLSPMFIKSEEYGTRSSTVILMNEEEIIFKERVFQRNCSIEQEFKIKLNE